jgi:hypothetical protein
VDDGTEGLAGTNDEANDEGINLAQQNKNIEDASLRQEQKKRVEEGDSDSSLKLVANVKKK